MRWNTICFDLDNTLFSHEEAFEYAIQHTFEKRYLQNGDSYNIDKKKWFDTFKKNSDYYWSDFEENKLTHEEYRKIRFDKTMKKFGLSVGEMDAKRFHDEYEEIVVQYSTPFDGVHKLLSTLYNANVSLGIITNGKRETQERKVTQLEIDKYIPLSHLVVSEDAGIEKPDKAIFDYALLKIGGDKDNSLFIGDSWHLDVMGAADAGWDAVFLNTRGEKRSTKITPVAEHYEFHETAQLLLQSLHLKG